MEPSKDLDEQIEDLLANAIDYYISGNGVQPEAKAAIRELILEVVDVDTGVDVPEAIKRVYDEGYSHGYNDRSYEATYDTTRRRPFAVAPAVAKIRGRYDKQHKMATKIKGESNV